MAVATPQQMQVASDHDMIVLRQAVRQAARAAGLGAAQQARFTAAISEVARAMISDAGESVFTIRTSEPPARSALEVVCAVTGSPPVDAGALYLSPNVAGARALVDDAQLDPHDPRPQLMLRMWLER
jgi:anti-sigma regulatory factor (Ser/Thr protein kinase)